MRVLITGGAGYIGRHVALAMYIAGHTIELLDSLDRGTIKDVKELEDIAGAHFPLHILDLSRDSCAVHKLFLHTTYDVVVHLACVKPVAGSNLSICNCYAIDIGGTMNLLSAMESGSNKRCNRLIFCSSASVYGERRDSTIAWKEEEWSNTACLPNSAYGISKYAIECVLQQLASNWAICVLRCPEVIGALAGGGLADTGRSNLISRIAGSTKNNPFKVGAGDPNTADGSPVRDYVHVTDIASAHVKALESFYIKSKGNAQGQYHFPRGIRHYNVATGKGTSVWQLVLCLQRALDKTIPCLKDTKSHRPHSIRLISPRKIQKELGWFPEHSLENMCIDSINGFKKVSSSILDE